MVNNRLLASGVVIGLIIEMIFACVLQVTTTVQVNTKALPEIDSRVQLFIDKPKAELNAIKHTSVIDAKSLIESACEGTSVDSEIAIAISRWETGHFKSDACIEYHNYGGMMINGKLLRFDSVEDGVEAFVYMLDNYYFSRGLTTVELIGNKYCPNDELWAKGVSQLVGWSD